MKIKEFSEKFGISYGVVQRASIRVRKYIDGKRHKYEFDENELGRAVKEELRDNIETHRNRLEDRENELRKIEKIEWGEKPSLSKRLLLEIESEREENEK